MQLVKPMYYKLLTVSKQIPDCPLEVGPGTPISKVGDQCLITSWLFPGDRVIILQELEESRRTFLYLALHVLVMILKNFYVFSDLY